MINEQPAARTYNPKNQNRKFNNSAAKNKNYFIFLPIRINICDTHNVDVRNKYSLLNQINKVIY